MTIRETTLNGQHILTIQQATPTNLHIELRINLLKAMSVTLYQDHRQVVAVTNVPAKDVLVGRITGELRCLFIDTAAIDVTPAAAEAIDAWLGRQLQALEA